MTRPDISPLPPIARDVGMPWDTPVDDPVATITRARTSYGDTFVVDSGPDRYLFTFSPAGVKAFYALTERTASKGVADWRMLRRKLPDEIFVGRRTLPRELFGKTERATQLANVDLALDATMAELGDSGTIDVFALTRRLGHRLGLASWGGPSAASGQSFDRLVVAFDQLDGSESFVHPDAMAAIATSGKAVERQALATIVEIVGAGTAQLEDSAAHPLFARIVASWDNMDGEERRVGVSYDVALLHIASMSNMFAALGWALIDLIAHPAERRRIAAGDTDRAEQCLLESTRLAQRSIMSRYVLEPVSFATGETTYRISPGVTIATLLPLTNSSAAPDLAEWQPDRWSRRRLLDAAALPATEMVTSFGHGRHTCPAQPFSLAAMTAVAARLFSAYQMTPIGNCTPRPEPRQIGGVARAHEPFLVSYCRT